MSDDPREDTNGRGSGELSERGTSGELRSGPVTHPTGPGSPGSIGATEERRTSWGGEELPTYRKVAGYPDVGQSPAPTHPVPPPPAGGTGQLPVTGTPVTAPPPGVRPRGPHLPTVVRGLFVLVLVAFVFVWRLVEDPNWAIVGITVGVAAGMMFLLAAAVSAVLHHSGDDSGFDPMLPGR